jgi:hypothetical protein
MIVPGPLCDAPLGSSLLAWTWVLSLGSFFSEVGVFPNVSGAGLNIIEVCRCNEGF